MTWPPFHPQARREFDEALEHITAESPASARRLVERTGATLRMLRQFPNAGRPVGALNRRFPVHPFRYHLIYFPAGDDLYVVAFAHERRQPEYWEERTIG